MKIKNLTKNDLETLNRLDIPLWFQKHGVTTGVIWKLRMIGSKPEKWYVYSFQFNTIFPKVKKSGWEFEAIDEGEIELKSIFDRIFIFMDQS